MTWTIRPAVAADAARLSEVARLAKSHWGYPAAWLSRWDAALAITPAYLEAHPVFAAEAGGQAAGFCALEDHRTHWGLEHLWVSPEEHGGGMGRALLAHALRHAHALRPGVVTVASDPAAAGFYTRCGGRRVGAAPAPMEGDPGRELPVFEFTTGAG